MPPRHSRLPAPPRGPVAPVHRGPQAAALSTAALASGSAIPFHAPNAALLIDFDNVTMGVRSDLNGELRNLLSSDIVKGKVSVQRAYADWRRYPQYIVPLAESSIDLIFAPAYGSSKKNATDIRLAIDALELVFTRPEIGTFILLSGDSDFSSLVIKLKEYGKYVIGVGIRESSSDLLVQNCDEYYSYNALAGLVNTREEEVPRWDPWELAGEAVQRMKRNGDVMRADRLKQVMQQIDSSFDEKNLGMSKFTRFVQEASHRGILTAQKMDNGQLEVDLSRSAQTSSGSNAEPDSAATTGEGSEVSDSTATASEPREQREPRERSRRGRGGRGREERRPRREQSESANGEQGSDQGSDQGSEQSADQSFEQNSEQSLEQQAEHAEQHTDADDSSSGGSDTSPTAATRSDRPPQRHSRTQRDSELPAPPSTPVSVERELEMPHATEPGLSGSTRRGSAPVAEAVAAESVAADKTATEADAIGAGGMRLTRDDAFNLMRSAVERATSQSSSAPVRASEVRRVAREILGRDSESLSERNFNRILMDAHDADVIDLRRRGNDYEVAAAVSSAPIGEQLGAAEEANAPAPRASAPAAPRGMGQRGAPPRGGSRGARARSTELPPDLLSVGVVNLNTPMLTDVPPAATSSTASSTTSSTASSTPSSRASAPAGQGSSSRSTTPDSRAATAPANSPPPADSATPAASSTTGAAKPPARAARARKKPVAKSAPAASSGTSTEVGAPAEPAPPKPAQPAAKKTTRKRAAAKNAKK